MKSYNCNTIRLHTACINIFFGNVQSEHLEQRYQCAQYIEIDLVGWLCWGLTSQSTIFQSYRDGAIASWVINQYFRGVKCLAQGHNTAAVGLEPRTSRSGVRHSTTEPPRSPTLRLKKWNRIGWHVNLHGNVFFFYLTLNKIKFYSYKTDNMISGRIKAFHRQDATSAVSSSGHYLPIFDANGRILQTGIFFWIYNKI